MHLDAITKQVGVMTTMEVPQQFRMEGWVYVLSNPCMPGIYKVGMTTTSPEVRARELSSATGVPAPFKI
ncbi:GIY-YIG nuclease family protein, partial [Klebsiella pneumoniae]